MVFRTKIGISLLCLSFAGFNISVLAEEDIYDQVCDYVKQHSEVATEQKWMRDWKKKAEQMMKDNDHISSESKAADEVFLKFLRERRKKLGDVQAGEQPEKLTATEKLEVCRFYLLFKDNGWEIDHDLADFITVENFKAYIIGDNIVPADKPEGKLLPPPRMTKTSLVDQANQVDEIEDAIRKINKDLNRKKE